MSDAIDDIDDEDDFETPDKRSRCLVDLFEWWDAFYEAVTPVAQAAKSTFGPSRRTTSPTGSPNLTGSPDRRSTSAFSWP